MTSGGDGLVAWLGLVLGGGSLVVQAITAILARPKIRVIGLHWCDADTWTYSIDVSNVRGTAVQINSVGWYRRLGRKASASSLVATKEMPMTLAAYGLHNFTRSGPLVDAPLSGLTAVPYVEIAANPPLWKRLLRRGGLPIRQITGRPVTFDWTYVPVSSERQRAAEAQVATGSHRRFWWLRRK